MRLGENAVVRALMVIVTVAVGIRVIFWLVAPVFPFLLAGLVIFTVVRIIAWWRGRW